MSRAANELLTQFQDAAADLQPRITTRDKLTPAYHDARSAVHDGGADH